MANIRPIDTPAQTGLGIPDEALGQGQDAAFEAQLEQAEAQGRKAGDLFGEHPDGVGQTLGGDLETPNPGHPVDPDDEDEEDEQDPLV